MPLSFDEWVKSQPGFDDQWLNETYGGEPDVNQGDGPAPFAPGEAAPSQFDEDINSFVGDIAEPTVAGDGPVPGSVIEKPEIEITPEESEADRLQSVGASVSTGGSGYNFSDAKTKQVKKGFTNQVDARNAASEAEIYGEAKQTADDIRRVTELAQGNAATRGELDMKKASMESEAAFQEADLIADLNFQEKLGYEQARIKEEEAMTNWVGAMKAYEASNINPGKLWGDMTGGERFGTAISVFAHNVLAAKGINTSVMSSLNKAIDDNLNAQMANMNKKERVAGQFKQVYEAVRSQSESEAEARMKMRALMMTEFRAGVTARLSSMDSDYAKLKAQEWAVAIEGDLTKQMAELRQVYRQNIERARNYNSDLMYKEAQLRMEAYRNSLSARQVALAEEAARGSGKLDTEAIDKRTIYDTSPGGESNVYLSKDEKDTVKLSDELAANNILIRELKKFQQDAREIYDGVGSKYNDSEADKQIRARHTALQSRIIKQWSGLSYTDKQQEFLQQILPMDTLLTSNAVNRTVGDLIDNATAENRIKLEQRAVRVTDPRVREYALGVRITGRDDKFQEADAAMGQELMKNQKPGQTEVDRMIGDAESDNKYAPRAVDKEFLDIWDKAGYATKTDIAADFDQPGRKNAPVTRVPKWAITQVELAEYVKNMSNPTEERLKALTYLRDKAYSNSDDFGQDETSLAWYIWEDLNKGGYLDNARF